MPRALLLDLDETLIDRGAAFRAWAGSWLDGEALEEAIRRDLRGYAPRDELLSWIAAQVGRSLEELREDYGPRLTALCRPAPGVLDALRALEGTPMILVSNGGARQRAKLEVTGLARWLPDPLISGELGIRKPDAAIFQLALERLGVAAGDARMIGDDPERDIVGAAAIGIGTCWIAHGRQWPEALQPPDHVAEDAATALALQ